LPSAVTSNVQRIAVPKAPNDAVQVIRSDVSSSDEYVKAPLGWIVTRGVHAIERFTQEGPKLLSSSVAEHRQHLQERIRERRK
jgi:hypothetical protein